jgi:Na+/H+-dicarboxylate symporter
MSSTASPMRAIRVGRVGFKLLVYFEVMTTIALAPGILLARGWG